MEGLVRRGLMHPPEAKAGLDHLVTATWVLSDHWLNYVEAIGQPVDAAAFHWGYEILISMIRPYFTPLGQAHIGLPEHFMSLSRRGAKLR